MFQLKPTQDLSRSAHMTLANMASYYQQYGVEWDHAQVLQQISTLDNWDILIEDKLVGALRLSFEGRDCLLRDIQVVEGFKNQGIGAAVLAESVRLAQNAGADNLQLKVFKLSPAHHLYKRFGFVLTDQDDRFFYMEYSIN